MRDLLDRLPTPPVLLRIALVLFVFVWIFGPRSLRTAVPIWLPFLVAVGLEVQFFVTAVRAAPRERRDAGPLRSDLERYGYGGDSDELVVVREGGREIWIPYSGESPEELQELADAAAHEPEQELEPPAEARRRPVRGLLVGLGLIGALALAFWIVEERTGWNGLSDEAQDRATARYSEEASRIAGKPVTVRCDEAGDFVGAVQHADGVAIVGGDVAYLTPERCLDLYRLAFDREVRANRTGRAIAVLAHEAWHLRGERDEGRTECYALQSGVQLGRRLGLSADDAAQLMRRQLVDNALRARTAPEYRIPSECRDGGELDVNPRSERFP